MYKRLPVNEFGQLQEHPDYYDDSPDYSEIEYYNSLLADCYYDYDEMCDKLMGRMGGYDYEDLPDLDDFKAEWFERYAMNQVEAWAALNDIDPNCDYCADLETSYAKYLQGFWRGGEPMATVEQYAPYFNGGSNSKYQFLHK